MKIRSIFALSLVFAMILSGCGDSKPNKNDDTSSPTDADTTVSEPNVLMHSVPDDLRFDGTPFRMLLGGGSYMVDPNCAPVANLDDFDTSVGMDVLQKASYDRIIMLEEKFGIEFEFLYPAAIDASSEVRMSVTSNSDDYDVVMTCGGPIQGTIYEGLYVPVSELPYIDLEKPWWNKGYIESVSLNVNEPFILFGAINFNSIQRSVCTVINNDMLESLKGLTPDDMYQTVLDGKWTLDALSELMKDVYTDENGNTLHDIEDNYAFIHAGYWQVDFMAYGAGLKFTERDDDGYPTLNINNERSIELAEKLLTLFNDKENIFNGNDSVTNFKLFGEGHSMVYIERFLALEKDVIRNSDVDYCILPTPKLDESIDNYYTPVERLVQWGLVPITAPDLSMISAVLEVMAYDGYENVLPAYYDITLKLKYTRGDDLDTASKMLDIITENQYTDFLGANALGGMETIFTRVVQSGENTFASTYASLETSANAKLEEMIKAIEG